MTEARVNFPREAVGVTSSGLLERVQTKDDQAWQRLVNLYSPLVAYWGRQSGLSEQNIADVSQDVFLSVAKYVERFHKGSTGGSFRGWLRTITATKIADLRRRQATGDLPVGGTDAHERLHQLPDETNEATEVAEETRLLFLRAVELIQTDFQENTWRAFWRTVIDGQTATDVAQELGISPNAVHLAKARVLGRLRQEFADLVEA